MDNNKDIVFYRNEQGCELKCGNGKKCTNKAYFVIKTVQSENKLVCGVHKHMGTNRRELPENPRHNEKVAQDYALHLATVEQCRFINSQMKIKGKLMVSKMYMMKNPAQVKGYLNIYPNFKHGGRKDGLGLKELSPKSLGPVNHWMTSILPVSHNLENFHQFSKLFDNETMESALQERIAAYSSDIPHRHKPSALGKNIPLCSIYYTKTGSTPMEFTYLESRWFYCHYYELLVEKTAQFAELKQLLESGTNINIVGYDGYDVTQSLWTHYNDTTRPFGHELVLYSLLLVGDNKDELPWNIYYAQNLNKYEPLFV